jgi:LemA protein
MLIAILIVALLLLAAAVGTLLSYNRMVRLRNRVQASWAQVDVQLRRRYDLVPNLVETVKGYAGHERRTLEAATAARADAQRAEGVRPQAQAETELTEALSSLFVLSERYPELKASTNFLQLQRSLVESENRIALARQVYNDTVQTYENGRQQLPMSIVASRFGFEPRSYFELELGSVERQPIRITT